MKETTTETAKETAKLERHKPHQTYTLDGITIPGVTTVLGIIDKSGPLIHWAWKLGMEGKDYKKVRDEPPTLERLRISCLNVTSRAKRQT